MVSTDGVVDGGGGVRPYAVHLQVIFNASCKYEVTIGRAVLKIDTLGFLWRRLSRERRRVLEYYKQ